MKRIFFAIMLIYTISSAQVSIKDGYNSSTTNLGASGVFTGTVREISRYSSITLSVFASDSSATNGIKVQFGDYLSGTFTPMRYYFFTYNSPDSLYTKTLPVSHPYYRVIYTNDTDSVTSFYLVTMLNTGDKIPTTTDGKVDVSISSSALPTGAAVSSKQDSLLAKAELMLTDLSNLKATISNVSSSLTPYDRQVASQTTVSTEVDTVTFTGTQWKVKWTVLAVDDTMEIDLHGAFSNPIPIYPGSSFTLSDFSATTFPKGYIRRKGTVGTVNYASIWTGF